MPTNQTATNPTRQRRTFTAVCVLFLLASPVTSLFAQEDELEAAETVNIQDVDAIIRSIPRRDEALKPKLAFYDRLRQEYEAKTKDTGAAKAAGAAAVAAFARAFATERTERTHKELYEGVLKQLAAAEKAGAKDLLLGLCRVACAHIVGYGVNREEYYQAPQIQSISAGVRSQYGDASLSGIFAQLCPNRIALEDKSPRSNSLIQLLQGSSLVPAMNTLLASVKDQAEEECWGELWFWGFGNSDPSYFFLQQIQADWRHQFGERPFTSWLCAEQAHDLGRRSIPFQSTPKAARDAGRKNHKEELARGLSLLPPEDRSSLAILLRIKCGSEIGRIRFDSCLRQISEKFWSPVMINTMSSFNSSPYSENFSMQVAQLRPYLESAVRQQRWDLCPRLLDCLVTCAASYKKYDSEALKSMIATDSEWFAPWCGTVYNHLCSDPGTDAATLSRFFNNLVACTEDPKTCRSLLQEDAARPASRLDPLILASLLGADWKAELSFRSACGHPLLGVELAAIGRDDPKSLDELRNLARQFKHMAKDADDEPLTKAYLAQRRWRYTQSLALLEGKTIEVPPDELGWIGSVTPDPQGFLRPDADKAAFVNLASLVFEEGVIIDAELQVIPGAAPTRFGLRNNDPGERNDTYISGLGVTKGTLSSIYRKKAGQAAAIDPLSAIPEAGTHLLRLCVSRQGYSLQMDGLLMSRDAWELRPKLDLYLVASFDWQYGQLAVTDPNNPHETRGHGLGRLRIRALKAPAPLPLPLDAAILQNWEKNQSGDLDLLIDSINHHLEQSPKEPIPLAALSADALRRLFASPVNRLPFTSWLQQQLPSRPCVPLSRPVGKDAWTAHANSEENGQYCAAHLIDGNYGSLWHSKWTHFGGVQPLHATLDLRQPQTLEGVRLSRRSDGPNGTPSSIFVQTSLDGKTWTGQRHFLAWQNGDKDHRDLDALFPAAATARYLRLTCYGTIACLAEVVPLGSADGIQGPAASNPSVANPHPGRAGTK